MEARFITEQEFMQFRAMLERIAGIHLSPAKKTLVSGRLAKRVQQLGMNSYGEYFKLLNSERRSDELQVAIDLLTTNETYFFREPRHFSFLRDHIAASRRSGMLRVWSAACSSGEEPYSIAMTLADRLGETGWEILASDLSTRVLERARRGHYAMERAADIPGEYLTRYCLRGTGEQEGTFLVCRQLRAKVDFRHINLNAALPEIGHFDVIFLRNVMIYFNAATKREVTDRLLRVLKPGGHLIIGHSESLHGIVDGLTSVAPSIYLKPEK